jgi:hypothetical protein
MPHNLLRTAAFAAALVLVSSPSFAQAPKVERAVMDQRTVSGNFEAFVNLLVRQQVKPTWVGYSVPAVAGQRISGWDNTVYLEGMPASPLDRPVRPDTDKTLTILFRVENKEIGRLGSYSPDITIDAGGLPFIWLTGVSPAESVRWLAGIARAAAAPDTATGTLWPAERLSNSAIKAVALHDEMSADTTLEQLVAKDQPMAWRRQAALWLGQSRGERGYQALRTAVANDPSVEFRKQVATALAQSRVPAAVDTLIQMARADADKSVRERAASSLAQTKDPRAIAFFEQVLKR